MHVGKPLSAASNAQAPARESRAGSEGERESALRPHPLIPRERASLPPTPHPGILESRILEPASQRDPLTFPAPTSGRLPSARQRPGVMAPLRGVSRSWP